MGTKREHADGNVIQGPWSRRPHTGTDESRRNGLVTEIADQIEAGLGSVVRWTAELDDVEEWRAAARRAGRLLDTNVRTGDLATARDALVRGLQGVPGHEKLYRLRMQLEHRCVGPTAVHGVFNDLTHQLDALDCEPSEETLATYHQLTGRRAAS